MLAFFDFKVSFNLLMFYKICCFKTPRVFFLTSVSMAPIAAVKNLLPKGLVTLFVGEVTRVFSAGVVI